MFRSLMWITYNLLIINSLPQARAKLIPGIVIFLQKMWRGAVCRLNYRRMLAAIKILRHYRLYKMRTYMLELNRVFRWVILDCSSCLIWHFLYFIMISLLSSCLYSVISCILYFVFLLFASNWLFSLLVGNECLVYLLNEYMHTIDFNFH